MTSNLPKPWKYKDWLIWENTAIDDMDLDRVGCSDTIEGICYKNLNIKECIDKSTDGFGYHVQFKNGNSVCVPIRTSHYPTLNVNYKLVNQNVHPELNNVSVSTFVNQNKYLFPPINFDTFFYFDVLTLKNIESGKILVDKDLTDNVIEFLSDENFSRNIQFVPKYSYMKQLEQYEQILYGEEFNIIIEGTTLFLTYDTLSNMFIWKQSFLEEQYNFFKIIPYTVDQKYEQDKFGKIIGYTDTFNIVYSNNIVLRLSDDNKLEGEYITIDKLIDRDNKYIKNTFSIISKMIAYHCKDNNCEPISYLDIYKNTDNKLLKNTFICRNKDCWGICKYLDKNTQSLSQSSYSTVQPPFKFLSLKTTNNWYIITMVILLIILASYLILINLLRR